MEFDLATANDWVTDGYIFSRLLRKGTVFVVVVFWSLSFSSYASFSSRSEFLLFPNTNCLKFWNAIMTTVTLSSDCLYKLFLSTDSTARPHC